MGQNMGCLINQILTPNNGEIQMGTIKLEVKNALEKLHILKQSPVFEAVQVANKTNEMTRTSFIT
jgi:hypothetical protein